LKRLGSRKEKKKKKTTEEGTRIRRGGVKKNGTKRSRVLRGVTCPHLRGGEVEGFGKRGCVQKVIFRVLTAKKKGSLKRRGVGGGGFWSSNFSCKEGVFGEKELTNIGGGEVVTWGGGKKCCPRKKKEKSFNIFVKKMGGQG